MRYDTLKIRQMQRRGLTWSEIQELLGCSRYTVWRALSDDLESVRKGERERKRRSRLCHKPKSR